MADMWSLVLFSLSPDLEDLEYGHFVTGPIYLAHARCSLQRQDSRYPAKMWPRILVSGNIRFVLLFARGPWRGIVKQEYRASFSVII